MDRKDQEELKPCPFCGGEAVLDTYKDEYLWSHKIVIWYQVGCSYCEVKTESSCEDKDDAIKAWNTRVGA